MTQVQDPENKVITYSFDSLNRVTKRTLPNDAETRYQYDAVSQLKQLTQLNPKDQVTDQYTFAYDPAGNKVTENNQQKDLSLADNKGDQLKGIEYEYDALNQLIHQKKHGPQETYYYDSVGNRIAEQNGGGNPSKYSYDANNRLVGINDKQGANGQEKELNYDRRGNLLQVRDKHGDILNEYTFDAKNKLANVKNQDGDTVENTYNGLGNRVKVTSMERLIPQGTCSLQKQTKTGCTLGMLVLWQVVLVPFAS